MAQNIIKQNLNQEMGRRLDWRSFYHSTLLVSASIEPRSAPEELLSILLNCGVRLQSTQRCGAVYEAPISMYLLVCCDDHPLMRTDRPSLID